MWIKSVELTVCKDTNMDNDHLFVCSSREGLVEPVGAPPFCEEIKEFAANLDAETFCGIL